jgi:hypothetical protein
MGMEQWWNDTDRGKLKFWERNIIQRDEEATPTCCTMSNLKITSNNMVCFYNGKNYTITTVLSFSKSF